MSSKLVTSRTLPVSFPSPESSLCSEDVRAVDQHVRGWYSERIPHSSHRSKKRYVAAAALMPFSSGRAMPSKWDDAERWISSPINVGNVSNNNNNNNSNNNNRNYYYYYNEVGVNKNSVSSHFEKRAKSKSGPLGPSGVGVFGSYHTFSPVLGVGGLNSGKWRNSLAIESPASAMDGGGVFEGGRRSLPRRSDPGWSDLWSGPITPSDKDKVRDGNIINTSNATEFHNDEANVSRRDMGTQMYQESESCTTRSSVVSSPRSNFSTNSPFQMRDELEMNVDFSEHDVKDVQVDNQSSRKTKRFAPMNCQVNEKSCDSSSLDGDNINARLQREEAKISAWENLQKAKAESSIQKLEMKLEKKRASSLEKIIEKLRGSEIKARNMRITLSGDSNQVQTRSILKTTSKIPSFCRRFRLNSSTRSCYCCYPF